MRAVAIAVLGVFAVFAAACGPSTKPDDPKPAPIATTPLPEANPASSPAPDPEPTADPAPAPDQHARCTSLVDHMFDVALSEYPGSDPTEIREAMAGERDRLIGDCTEGAVSDDEFKCAMAATTAADMEKCAPR